MSEFREMNAASDRKVGRSGHLIADKAGIESLFSKVKDKAHADKAEKEKALTEIGMRQEAAEAIAENLEAWDAGSFYDTVIAIADGPGVMLGTASRSFKDGVLTSREMSRLFDSVTASTTQTAQGTTHSRRRGRQSSGAASQAQGAADVSTDEKKYEFIYKANPGLAEAQIRVDGAGARDDIIRNQVCTEPNKSQNPVLAAKCTAYAPASDIAWMTGSGDQPDGFSHWRPQYDKQMQIAVTKLDKPSIPAKQVGRYEKSVRTDVENYKNYFNGIADQLDTAKSIFSEDEINDALKKQADAAKPGLLDRLKRRLGR